MEDEDTMEMGDDRRLADTEDAGDAGDSFELELDGSVHVLPAALKGAFLRQADYTRKTQELAEHRRSMEAEREALAEERRRLHGATGDRALVVALDQQVGAYAEIDWESLSQADPQRAEALWAQAVETRDLRDALAQALEHHDSREELRAARAAAEAMAETGRRLSQEIDGWSPEVAQKLVEFAQAFDVTLEELRETADPRLWKLLHRAWRAEQAGEAQAQAQASTLRPAVSIAGGGGGAGGVRDELGLKEWMRRRNAHMTGGR